MTSLDTLAAYYVQCARKEKVKEKKKMYFTEVWSVGGWATHSTEKLVFVYQLVIPRLWVYESCVHFW